MKSNDKILDELVELMEQSSSKRIANNLRILLIDYLVLHEDYPIDVKEILIDINILFDLLDLLSKLDATNSEGPPH
jgi:hypothetical protein